MCVCNGFFYLRLDSPWKNFLDPRLKWNDEPDPLVQWPSTLPLEQKDKTESHITRSGGSRNLRTRRGIILRPRDCFDVPSHIPYAFVLRVENKIHIVIIAC